MEAVFAKKAGKAKIALSSMRRPGSACPIAPEMAFLTSKPSNASATRDGWVRTALQDCATSIVALMDGKSNQDRVS